MRNGWKQGAVIISISILLVSIYLVYNFIINPRDEFGNRCQTLYNQKQYELVTKDKIDIPEKSCFVSECCSHVATFRSKKNYESLTKELENLEKSLNSVYSNLEFEINVTQHDFYNTYIIKYFQNK